MFDIEPRNVANIISCSVCCPTVGDFIKEVLRGLIFSYLKKLAKFSKPPPLCIILAISVFTKIFFLCLISYLFELFTNLSSRLFNSNRNMKTIFKQKKSFFEAFIFVFTMIEKSFNLKLGV